MELKNTHREFQFEVEVNRGIVRGKKWTVEHDRTQAKLWAKLVRIFDDRKLKKGKQNWIMTPMF